MHESLKSTLYADARKYLNEGMNVRIWTGWDDPTNDGATEISNLASLKKVFKYAYNTGWAVIRVEPVHPIYQIIMK